MMILQSGVSRGVGVRAIAAPSEPVNEGYMLEDFESAIYQVNPSNEDPQFRDLWNQYPNGDISGSGHKDYGAIDFDTSNKIEGTRSARLTMETGTSVTDYAAPYFQFYSNTGGSWRFLRYIAETLLGNGTWELDTYNRFEFYIKTPSGVQQEGAGQYNLTVGTYYSSVAAGGPDGSSAEVGGNHYYHRFDIPPSRWVKCLMDFHPTHIRGQNGGTEQGNKHYPAAADSGSYNYFDLLTRIYFDIEQNEMTADGTIWNFDSFRFYEETRTEEEDKVYSICGSYDSGSNSLIVGWNRRKDEGGTNHEVAYAFSDIHDLGFDNATYAGEVSSLGAIGYNAMEFSSTGISMGANTSIFVAVRQVGATLFKQIEIRLDL